MTTYTSGLMEQQRRDLRAALRRCAQESLELTGEATTHRLNGDTLYVHDARQYWFAVQVERTCSGESDHAPHKMGHTVWCSFFREYVDFDAIASANTDGLHAGDGVRTYMSADEIFNPGGHA